MIRSVAISIRQAHLPVRIFCIFRKLDGSRAGTVISAAGPIWNPIFSLLCCPAAEQSLSERTSGKSVLAIISFWIVRNLMLTKAARTIPGLSCGYIYGTAMSGYHAYFTRHQKASVFHPDSPSDFQSILEQILILEKNRAGNRELLENELLHRLVTQILTWQTEIPVKKEDNLASKLLEIRGFLDEHFTEKIFLDELANQFYISKYHMSREFKKAFGITVGSYVNSQRITKAKELLRFSDQQIEAIARACGIDDNSYFNKVFQKAEGITAREYRRKWRGQ